MNFKQKLGYMFIGCLFTIAGYILASLGGATHAQQNEQVIDKIVCKQLEVVNKAGKRVVNVWTNEIGKCGVIDIFNTAGKRVASIGATEDGGGIAVFNTEEKVVVEIGANEHGGIMGVLNNAGNGGVAIGVTEDGKGYIRTSDE
jgi:hypothetical protein